MIHGTFIVKDDISDTAAVQSDINAVTGSAVKSGGCGCGGMK
jgi:hypothetical protein